MNKQTSFLFPGRSRSEDSVYSPASEDGGLRSEGSSDSKSSLDGAAHQAPPLFTHGLGPALAALRKKRKKFSASRLSTPAMTSSTNTNPADSSATSVATILAAKISSQKQLQRASSVPTRGPELTPQSSVMLPRRHEVTQSQQPSLDVVEIAISEHINVQQGEPRYYDMRYYFTRACRMYQL